MSDAEFFLFGDGPGVYQPLCNASSLRIFLLGSREAPKTEPAADLSAGSVQEGGGLLDGEPTSGRAGNPGAPPSR